MVPNTNVWPSCLSVWNLSVCFRPYFRRAPWGTKNLSCELEGRVGSGRELYYFAKTTALQS